MVSTFLLGGARSGKSALSEHLATGLGLSVTAVVTAELIDDEMSERVRRHQEDRPTDWSVIEAPYDLVAAVATVPVGETVLVDCVTVWLSNLLVRGDDVIEIERQGRALAELLASRSGPSIVVSNEVGLGIVPGDPLSRSFRDVQGRVNQALATSLDHAYFVLAGQVLPLASSEQVLDTLRSGVSQANSA